MGQVLQTTDWLAANRVSAARLGELGVVSFCLAPGESTSGHSHTLVEEVTIFLAGEGQIEIEADCLPVCAGSVSVVPDGEFHCITNTGSENLEGVIVFNSNIDRKAVTLKNRKQHFGAKGEAKDETVVTLSKQIKKLEKKLAATKAKAGKSAKGKNAKGKSKKKAA